MEVHQQQCIQYAAIDSGASSHFCPIKYTGEHHNPTADPIRVGCANKAVIVSLRVTSHSILITLDQK